jgi:chitooligosaccharide deacetylase
VWIFIAIGVGVLVLAHTAPAPFLFDAIARDRAVWHMPKRDPPTVYLTFDDGPNPTTTPDLLDVLAREQVQATFFLIDQHITNSTAPIVRHMFASGHSVAVHSRTRRDMLMSPDSFAKDARRACPPYRAGSRGRRPCRAFRPHAWLAELDDMRRSQDNFRLIRMELDAVGPELVPSGQLMPW